MDITGLLPDRQSHAEARTLRVHSIETQSVFITFSYVCIYTYTAVGSHPILRFYGRFNPFATLND